MASYHLVNFLAERGFYQNIDQEFRFGILDFLPYLLERSIWERISETPPELVKSTSRDSVYVNSRINEVVRYHIWKSDLGRIGVRHDH